MEFALKIASMLFPSLFVPTEIGTVALTEVASAKLEAKIEQAQKALRKWFIMLDDGIEFLRDKRCESFVENGKLIAPLESVVLFNKIWQRLEKDCKTIHFPETIVWIIRKFSI